MTRLLTWVVDVWLAATALIAATRYIKATVRNEYVHLRRFAVRAAYTGALFTAGLLTCNALYALSPLLCWATLGTGTAVYALRLGYRHLTGPQARLDAPQWTEDRLP